MSKIKAIETVYDGYKFRSRLEARWAVFWNKMGLGYDYEPEGFDLGIAWYLPDFWLRELQWYVEIKPFFPDWSVDPPANLPEKIRYMDLADELACVNNKNVLVIEGSPWFNDYSISFFRGNRQKDIPHLEGKMQWGECRRCHALWLWRPYDLGFHVDPRINIHDCRGCTERAPTGSERLDVAFTAARQARF